MPVSPLCRYMLVRSRETPTDAPTDGQLFHVYAVKPNPTRDELEGDPRRAVFILAGYESPTTRKRPPVNARPKVVRLPYTRWGARRKRGEKKAEVVSLEEFRAKQR